VFTALSTFALDVNVAKGTTRQRAQNRLQVEHLLIRVLLWRVMSDHELSEVAPDIEFDEVNTRHDGSLHCF